MVHADRKLYLNIWVFKPQYRLCLNFIDLIHEKIYRDLNDKINYWMAFKNLIIVKNIILARVKNTVSVIMKCEQ